VDPLIVLFGLGVGILVGLTGMGGGSLMTPLLIIVFGVKPVTAIGTDIAYAAVTKTVGGVKHWRQNTVDLSLSTWMAVGSLPAAIAGVITLSQLQRAFGASFDTVVLSITAGALLLTGTAMLARIMAVRDLAARERTTVPMGRREKLSAVMLGVFVGFILGVTSAGSGALIAVGLVLIFRLVPHRVVGTDVFHAAILLWAAAIAHVTAGNVDYGLAGNILVGSVPGVWVGSHMSVRIASEKLRVALALVVCGSGLGIASKAGAPIPPAAIAAVLVVLAVYLVPKARAPLRERETVRAVDGSYAVGVTR
jgi:uncharacterized membrane protein YfcA